MPAELVMGKFKRGELHSGSKKGPKVKSRKQAIAIMMSEKRKGEGVKKKAYGSGPFSKKEEAQGYKVMAAASELQSMDVDRLAYDDQKDYTLAKRRDPTKGSFGSRKVFRRSEGKE